MFFNKKSKINCSACNSKVSKSYDFCPHCGQSMKSRETMEKEYGLLGKNDYVEESLQDSFNPGLGITDKLIGSIMNSLIRNLDKQFREMEKSGNAVERLPNGIKIRIGQAPMQEQNPQRTKRVVHKNTLSNEQLKKMSDLPRETAKTNIRRFTNKVVYELNTPGVLSPQDVLISKLEKGYEIKAISDKKVYVNSLPIELPIKGFILDQNKLLIEFKTSLE